MSSHNYHTRLLLAAVALFWATGQCYAQSQASMPQHDAAAIIQRMTNKTSPAQRKAAAARYAAARNSQTARISSLSAKQAMNMPMPGTTPDYFGIGNWTNSPVPTIDPITGTISGGIRKFVDRLPGLGFANANNLGQYLPVAIPDKTTYPGSDYYEIALVEYTEKMHSDLPPTRLRGYVQTNTTDPTVSVPHYLGPMIVAQKDRPVRIKFTNLLPTGAGGDLFIPVDTTTMGAGMGPYGMNPPVGDMNYTQNRATLHLHGGHTPWISDGTPHQWITPAGEVTSYPKGVSVQDVPDMPDPGDGSMTFFYTNQQSARLMFYHDHAYGITRLNVYAGEAAGYIIEDPTEHSLVANGIIPSEEIPLIIQDKTFVPDDATLAATDPTWDTMKWGGFGQLWFPHVYSPNQNPYDDSGANPFGRYDYGPWFWPPVTAAAGLKHGEVPNPYYDPVNAPWEPPMIPGVPNVSMVMEAFMDTPVVNGTAYPFLPVERKAYRFRILNACNDRMLNLQLYYAKSNTPDSVDPNTGLPTLQTDSGEVAMVPAERNGVGTAGYTYPDQLDGRDGGVPDSRNAGPSIIQIGTEGGILPAPVVIPNQPIGYNYNRRDIVVLNVSNHALFLGPAERADVIIDFSQVPDGSKLILYNDSPAPVPGFDPRFDYYTGDPDMTSTGGAPSTIAGYGPNIRTIMQFQVSSPAAAPAFDLAGLQAAVPAAFRASQPPIIVPQVAYGGTKNTYSRIQDTSLTFTPAGSSKPITLPMQSKAIQELFELDYGRMNATLGTELPLTNFLTQTTIPLGYVDPPTEIINDSVTPGPPTAGDGTQIWKITHNGVDTHAIHFHLYDVQLINRVGWDGAIRPPDPNELGWKDTVRMNPLEDCIVALRPTAPKLPFGLPDSIRPLNPAMPLGTTDGLTQIDPFTNNPITVVNEVRNFGWEYVWHCHLLGHEEMDMMRPIVFNVARQLPSAPVLAVSKGTGQNDLTWTDGTPVAGINTWGNPANEIGFRIERGTGAGGALLPLATARANQTAFSDTTALPNLTYRYRVVAFNAAGGSNSNIVTVGTTGSVPAAPSNLRASSISTNFVILSWNDNSNNEQGFYVQRSINGGVTWTTVAQTAANSSTYRDNALVSKSTYQYRVQAFNTAGGSAYSNVLTVTTR